uniref:NADPH--cytochrome P450 reductase n=1 Tax=Phallusia mammillata TaxID=59560 RepID=A0A6F9DPY8_9ASCI|nr:NADPH--cytochrome P450 reductase [Phallusia mammillata]
MRVVSNHRSSIDFDLFTALFICLKMETPPEESTPFLSTLDLFLLSALAGFLVYWFFFRKDETPNDEEFKKLTVVQPTGIQRSASFEAGFIARMKKAGRNIAILYGSQTGTAEEFAGRLAKDAQRYGMKALVLDPEEMNIDDLPQLTEIENSLVIFCMATYGEGDPTDNAQDFYDWLQQGETKLNGLRYAVFGLGNKTYEHYNLMGEYVDRRMAELGGDRVYTLGLGDDDTNIEEDFVTWKEGLWPVVCQKFGVEASVEDGSFRAYTYIKYDSDEIDPNTVYKGEVARLHSYKNQRPPYDAKNPYLSPVIVNKELHKGGDRSCMHIEFNITGSRMRYEAGDHVAVYPTNNVEMVEKIGKRLNLDLDTLFTLNNVDEDSSKRHPFPCPTTFRTALTHYLDISHPLRTNILHEFAEYCSDEKDKEFLNLLSSATPEGKKEYQHWVMDSRRHLLAILDEVPSCNPPIDHICELLPRLQARYYSIASSPKEHSNSIHICAVVVEYKTLDGRTNYGVATNWLKNKIPVPAEGVPQPTVPIYVRKSQFRLPFKVSHPVIMVGPGTGLAPFIGFIQDRAFHKRNGKDVGKTILYFGCRKQSEDFIYEELLEDWKKEGVLTELNLAFSRDSEKKVYVQNLIENNKQSVWDVIDNHGHIYVCGDARHMARDVHDAIVDIVCECGGKTHQQAVDFVKALMNKGRYSADVWS